MFQKFKYFKVVVALFEILWYKLQGIFGRTIVVSHTHKMAEQKFPPFYQLERDKIKTELWKIKTGLWKTKTGLLKIKTELWKIKTGLWIKLKLDCWKLKLDCGTLKLDCEN